MATVNQRHIDHSRAWIQGSATGFPLTRTTIVGFPAAWTACTSCSWAPTRPRSDRSTCSPVVAFVPGVQRSVWSRDQVPTMTIAASADLAASTAAGIPDGSLDQSLEPSAYLISMEVFERCWVKPASGEMPLFVALKKT